MNNLLLVPILLPLICAALLMTASRNTATGVRLLSVASVVLLLCCEVY